MKFYVVGLKNKHNGILIILMIGYIICFATVVAIGVRISNYIKSLKQKATINRIISQLKKEDFKTSNGRVLCIVNPISGRGKSKQLYNELIRPVFESRGWQVETLLTRSMTHAWTYIRSLPTTTKYELVVVIGGDGLFFETLNGFRSLRLQHPQNKDIPPLVIVPLGTSNGLFTSLFPEQRKDPLLNQVWNIVDVASQNEKKQTISVGETVFTKSLTNEGVWNPLITENNNKIDFTLSVSIGIIADADIWQETKLRFFPKWAADFRVFLSMIIPIISRKQYRVKMRYMPVQLKTNEYGEQEIVNDEPREEIGDFLGVSVIKAPWLSNDAFMAPDAKLQDKLLHVILIKHMNLISLLKTFMGIEKGEHVSSPYVSIIKCSTFELDPLDSNATVVVDGAVIGSFPFRCSVQVDDIVLNC
jgi:diacylglycerol kinase family enzyme